MVQGLAFRLLGKDADLDEVVQDAFVEALSSLDSLRDPSAFRSWLGTIVVHRARLHIRRRVASAVGLGKPDGVDVDLLVDAGTPDLALELSEARTCIAALGPEERTALLLYRVEGYTLPEVAAEMRLSLATVKRRLASADEKLAASRARPAA